VGEGHSAPAGHTARAAARIGATLVLLTAAIGAQVRDASPSRVGAADAPRTVLTFADVRPIWGTLGPHLPPELAGRPLEAVQAGWDEWVRAHDAGIRARVARGDEDSLVNLWLFGTTFTSLPPARPRDVELHGGGATLAQIADERLQELLEALAAPGANDRLRWAGGFFRERGLDPATSRGQARVRDLLTTVAKRMLGEDAEYKGALEALNAAADPLAWMLPYASLYRDRGLSSDTSILSSFAVDSALGALSASGMIPRGTIARVAIVGPGLDFLNKADGHDFYPEQTIQPFAVIDSLRRHGLAAGNLAVTTFDVSGRVNGHLEAARDRARAGEGYVVHLPLGGVDRWAPELVAYWERAGDRVGEGVRASTPPSTATGVKIRAVRIEPEVVLSILPRDLNVIVERLDLSAGQRFDLVIATNVFVYYAAFQQALAIVNIGGMIRPGGSLLSNQAIVPVPPMKAAVGHDRVVYSERQFDHLFWYQRD